MKRLAITAITAIALMVGMASSADAAPYRDCPGRVWGWKHEVDPQTTTCQLGRYALVVYLRELQEGSVPHWIWARSLKTGLTYELHLVRMNRNGFTYVGQAGQARLRVRLHSTLY